VAVAFSGGVDSTVLLHVLHALSQHQPLRVSALHVDHGISPRSREWAQFCAAQCEQLGVSLQVLAVTVPKDGGEGLEAAARAARYAAFSQVDADALALAHHLDDQAETVLLQLLRGAGAAGWAAMPEVRALAGSRALLVRPLLHARRSELEAYARERGLRWIDDESNASRDFDRNYLRHEVLPRVGARFPAYRETLARASRNAADLDAIAGDMARSDAMAVVHDAGMRVSALRALSRARQLNLLRWFIAARGLPTQPRERLEEALRQLLVAADDRDPCLTLGTHALRRHRGLIRMVPVVAKAAAWRIAWAGERVVQLPAGWGELCLSPTIGAGLSARRLHADAVSIAPRSGGERIKLAWNRPQRTLKNLLREADLGRWERAHRPLLFCGEALAWVPGLGADVRFAAARGERGLLPEWSGAQPGYLR
jgi:tRNA(Ile)-lysidine synthase